MVKKWNHTESEQKKLWTAESVMSQQNINLIKNRIEESPSKSVRKLAAEVHLKVDCQINFKEGTKFENLQNCNVARTFIQ